MHQEELPEDEEEAQQRIADRLEIVLSQGGEGIVLRDPKSAWYPKRHRGILKHKPIQDDEGVIVGFTSGRAGKEDRCLGKIGALVVQNSGKEFKVSGLTDAEREFETNGMSQYAANHPDCNMPAGYCGRHFSVGQVITYKYMRLTDDGYPREPRYFRKRDVE